MVIICKNGTLGVFSFVDGFVPAKAPSGRHIPEEDVLAYAEEIALKKSPQEAYAYLDRWAQSCVI